MPKYKSAVTGRYVSAYYAKRHPATTYEDGSRGEVAIAGDNVREEVAELQGVHQAALDLFLVTSRDTHEPEWVKVRSSALDELRDSLEGNAADGEDVAPSPGVGDQEAIVAAARDLFDNRLGHGRNRQPYAPRDVWAKLGEALYGADDVRVRHLRGEVPDDELGRRGYGLGVNPTPPVLPEEGPPEQTTAGA